MEGVEGLPDRDSPLVRARFVVDGRGGHVRGLDGMATNIKNAIDAGKKVTILSTGPETNVALFISVYPDLLHGIEQFVFMGGGVGVGNVSAVAGKGYLLPFIHLTLIKDLIEFNILCDPEAAQILLNAPVKTVMVPMNVTHTAIMKEHLHAELTSSDTPLRRMISSLITFFADVYKSKFGFMDGCPLHDPLVVCWVSHPELYQSKRYRVDVELNGSHTSGETVVDVWNYRQCDDSWGPSGKNCIVAESLDVIIPLGVISQMLTHQPRWINFSKFFLTVWQGAKSCPCGQVSLMSKYNKSELCMVVLSTCYKYSVRCGARWINDVCPKKI